MAKTDLTNQRQVFVEEYVRSGDHLEAAKKAGYGPQVTRVLGSILQEMWILLEGV
jgi:phage terminase small subunit